MLKLAVTIVTLFLSAVSFAQTAAGNLQAPAYKFEITPFIGYRTGGQYEFLYARQSTEVDSGGVVCERPAI